MSNNEKVTKFLKNIFDLCKENEIYLYADSPYDKILILEAKTDNLLAKFICDGNKEIQYILSNDIIIKKID
jgi:hypothetical protein